MLRSVCFLISEERVDPKVQITLIHPFMFEIQLRLKVNETYTSIMEGIMYGLRPSSFKITIERVIRHLFPEAARLYSRCSPALFRLARARFNPAQKRLGVLHIHKPAGNKLRPESGLRVSR